ncbi:MAG: SPFH domain-containing protein [Bacteroidota bacterium]
MGLWDKIKGELIDIIEWIDTSNGELVSHKYDRKDNQIKNGAKLTVRESQIAVFIDEGQFADIFTPGMYSLTTENLPFLSKLKGWKHGFDSPFRSEVYFINTGMLDGLLWGTPGPLNIFSEEYDNIQFTANGSFICYVDVDPADRYAALRKFFSKIIQTDNELTKKELQVKLRQFLSNYLEPAFQQCFDAQNKRGLNINKMEAATTVKSYLDPHFKEFGLLLNLFTIGEYDYDEATKKLKESRQATKGKVFDIKGEGGAKKEVLDMYNDAEMKKYMQYQMGQTMEKSAGAEGGGNMMGNLMGAGMGFAMGNQMGGMMNSGMQGGGAPPPVPGQIKFFVVVNGQQAGPFEMAQMQQSIQAGQLKKEMMVWKEGMAAWAQAGTVPELAALFNATPPPITPPPPPVG